MIICTGRLGTFPQRRGVERQRWQGIQSAPHVEHPRVGVDVHRQVDGRMPHNGGVRFRNEMEAGPGGQQIQLEDPDGNPIELFEPARSSWFERNSEVTNPRRTTHGTGAMDSDALHSAIDADRTFLFRGRRIAATRDTDRARPRLCPQRRLTRKRGQAEWQLCTGRTEIRTLKMRGAEP